MLKHLVTMLLLLSPMLAWAQADKPTKTVTDGMIPEGAEVTFYADTVYVLSGIVFVDSLATLNIEAGTIVKAEGGQGNEASGLVITRGGQIFAEGTATEPIIFTSVLDDTDDPNDLTYEDRGLWGGVVMLGQASTNNPTPGGQKQIEGINEIVGEGDTRAVYGGTDDAHSSGVFRYVSIRHTGINVGDQAGNEIQGLTLGAVGSGTTIEYVESFASADDGFEFFGGTVNTKYLVSAFNEDDSFDYDEGFRGLHQFWFALQADDVGGRTAEMDGATGNEFFEPYAIPLIYNATYIGPDGGTAAGDGAEMLIFRDNAGGKYYNSLFAYFDAASGGLGITVEDIDNAGDTPQDSRKRLEAGDIVLQNNLWWGFGAGNELAQFAPQDFVQAYLGDAANANRIEDPEIRGISRMQDNGLDPRPGMGSPAMEGARTPDDDFFTETTYVGAFGEENWLVGWTALDQLGFVGDVDTAIETLPGEVPNQVSLDQNYPNPFNPSTSITFQIDRAQQVRLAVYDLLGREVAVLLDGTQAAGAYRATFDAAGFASGLYLYKLTTERGVITKSMTLLK